MNDHHLWDFFILSMGIVGGLIIAVIVQAL